MDTFENNTLRDLNFTHEIEEHLFTLKLGNLPVDATVWETCRYNFREIRAITASITEYARTHPSSSFEIIVKNIAEDPTVNPRDHISIRICADLDIKTHETSWELYSIFTKALENAKDFSEYHEGNTIPTFIQSVPPIPGSVD